jgi:hypothetical protein
MKENYLKIRYSQTNVLTLPSANRSHTHLSGTTFEQHIPTDHDLPGSTLSVLVHPELTKVQNRQDHKTRVTP